MEGTIVTGCQSMSRSRPTKLEKYRERKVIIAHEVVEHTRRRLEGAELAAKTPDEPDVIRERHNLAEARKLLQEAIAERNGR
jgi:hypothetical protein